jgi:hypothetical protein
LYGTPKRFAKSLCGIPCKLLFVTPTINIFVWDKNDLTCLVPPP